MLLLFSPVQAVSAESLPVIDIHVQFLNSPTGEADTPQVDNRSTEFVEILMKEAGLRYEFHVSPMARSLQLLETRENVLVYPLSRIPEREHAMRWIGMVRPIQLSLMGLKAKREALPTTLEEAKEYRIGIFRDGLTDIYLRSQGFTKLVYYNDITNSVQMLERNRFDLFSFEPRGIENFLRLNGYESDLAVPVVHLEAIRSELFYVLSQPTEAHIQTRLQEAFSRLIANGTFRTVMEYEYDSEWDDF